MIQILSIKPVKRKKDLFHIQLDKGEDIQVNAILISQFDLYSGKSISSAELSDLRSAAEILSLKNYSLTILAKKMYSVAEIKNKLRKRTKNDEYIEQVIFQLSSLGLLDDNEYAELYIRSLKNKNKYSWKEIRFRLYQKGIKMEKENFDHEAIDQYEMAVVRKLIEKKLRQNLPEEEQIKERKKIFDYLYKKGFSTEIISRILSQLNLH